MDKVKAALAWFQRTRIARTLGRYGAANGALLSGGIAFSALFSIFAALTIGFTIFLAVLGNDAQLRTAVLEQLAAVLPGIIDTGNGEGILSADDLRLGTGGGIAGIIAVLVLLNTALTVMAYLRSGVRAMFGTLAPKESPVLSKVRDLAGFLALAAAVLATAALGIAAGALADVVLDALGLAGAASVVVRALTLLVAVGVDFLVFVFVLRVLAGIRPPRRDLIIGSLVGAIAAGVIRLLGTTLVANVSDNPLLAGFAAIITLLLWVNLVVRVTLLVSAWIANPPMRPQLTQDIPTRFEQQPNYVTVSEPHTLTWDHDPVTGRIRPGEPEAEQPYWGGLIGKVRDRLHRPEQPDAEELAAAHTAPNDPTDTRPGQDARAEGSR